MSWSLLFATALAAAEPASPVQAPVEVARPASDSVAPSVRLVQALRLDRGIRVTLEVDHAGTADRLEVRLDTGVDRLSGRDPWSFVVSASGSAHLEATLFFPGAPREGSGQLIVSELSEPYREGRCPIDLAHDPRPPRIPGVIATFRPPLEALGPGIQLREGRPGPKGEGWTRIYTDLPDITLAQVRAAIELPTQIWAGPGGFLFVHPTSGREAIALEVREGRIISGSRIGLEEFRTLVGAGTRYTNRVWSGR
ncbi:MAG: hypothetical protein VKP72_07095 [bacterium]|nr:hypothetical protein [bacterium]